LASLSALEEPAARSTPSLNDLSWLVGHWVGREGEVISEEWWTEPAGLVMLGMHRDVSPGAQGFFEYLRIVARADGVVYIAQPLGRPPTDFPLVDLGPTRVVFENLLHDFPQRIIYRLADDGVLVVRIEGEIEGERRSSEWRWSKSR
jgi:hypothetical protein